uniref:Allatostatin c n=4 Tax=Cellia TaxID=44534 RepID=A0A6E8VZM4_ANOCL
DLPEINPNELRKLYTNYNSYVSNQLDNYGLDPLQLQLLAQYAQSNAISGGGGGGWDQLYRAPEMKRQIRYRQCYFNPISCFKK